MTSIFDITDWAHVASFFVWTLAVCALAKAIFGSFPAAELQYRLALRDNPRRRHLNRLNWEVANRAKWNDDVARHSPHAARQPLTDDEIEAKRRELQQLARTSFAWRAFTYFMGCFACQTFWAAVATFLVTQGAGNMADCFFSAAAYSGMSVLLSSLSALTPGRLPEPMARKPGCKNCGH